MQQPEYDVSALYQEAQTRWLKPAEVFFILQNHERFQLTPTAPQKPTSGSLFLFNKRVLKFFRKDGHQWRRKRDGRAIAEAHERLKVSKAEALNCYYAHGEHNPNFQRRSYWMLDPANEHIVLVHYRDVSEGKEGKQSSGHILHFSPNASTFLSSTIGTQNTSYIHYVGDSTGFRLQPSSPRAAEISSESDGVETPANSTSSSEFEIRQALRRLEEQLSLGDDNVSTIVPFIRQNENENNLGFLESRGEIPESNKLERCYGGYVGNQDHSDKIMLVKKDSGSVEECRDQESESWKYMLEGCEASLVLNSEEATKSSKRYICEVEDDSNWNHSTQNEQPSYLLPQEPASFEVPSYSSVLEVEAHENISSYYSMIGNQEQVGMPLEHEVSLTVAQKQKFTIQEISPEWGYANETTKVIIVGSFLCDPTESTWTCMFGSTEVPLQIIKEGVLSCVAPPCQPGKVNLCITSGNRASCSEIREFEYRAKASQSCSRCSMPQTSNASRSLDELLLLARFVQMLLSDPQSGRANNLEAGTDNLLMTSKADDDKLSHVIETILDGSATSPSTVDWILQELLRDKLHSWLSSRSQGEDTTPSSLSKKEQGVIHMVAGLGFEWALNPILSLGVGVDFRDINGWSALHWAARFGREKMVAALIALGASAVAVTDPTSLDPVGKTAASIAASSGHKGLAGYLSEVALTNHLSSLTLEETEISKGSAQVQAEITVSSISKPNLPCPEDQLSLKDSLAAVRNAAQAAARIQAAFRAHSFRKRQQREAAAAAWLQEYGINSADIQGLSAMPMLAFGNTQKYNSAALAIQKKYRGWKGRKDFLALRQKVVKIQAHVRGYQARKQYKVICWAVGILDKAVLRWRRKGVGLRGFRQDEGSTDGDESEDEDFLREFREQKVYGAVNKAFSRVLSMVKSPDARQQYRRMLERYLQAKAELTAASASGDGSGDDALFDISEMEKDDFYLLL